MASQTSHEELLVWVEPIPGETAKTKIFENICSRHHQLRVNFLSVPEGGHLDEDVFLDATIICTFGRLPTSRALAPRLRIVHLCSSGSNRIHDHWVYADPSIIITTASGLHGPQIAEWVVLQLLSYTHQQKLLLDWHSSCRWGDAITYGLTRPLLGRRLGVLGYGGIGRQVARVCAAMGMDIVAFTANPRDTPDSRRDSGYIVPGTGDPDGTIPSAWYSGLDRVSVRRFLSQDIDILLVSLPLTAKTVCLLGKEELAILGKRKAVFLNVARGQIVDQMALAAALRDGELSFAAVDVTDPEPLPPGNLLWQAPNLVVTPHIAGQAVGYYAGVIEILNINLARLAEGGPLLNTVDRAKGY